MVRLKICCNATFIGKDKLTRGAFIDSSSILTPIPAVFLALSLPDIYTNVDLQRTIKLALKLFI